MALSFATDHTASPDNVLWLDFETSGLSSTPGFAPLELAAIITDAELNELATLGSTLFEMTPEVREAMVPLVVDMHRKTGLLRRLATEEVHSYAEVDRILSGFAAPYFPERKSELADGSVFRGIVLGGNSLAGVDLPVLQRFLPATYAQCDYRTLDVSAVGELIKRVNRPVYEIAKGQKASDHTALTDIRACIDEARHYRDHAMVAG